MNTSLKNDILYTMAYFNAMKYPLTIFELWRYCISKENKKAVSFFQVLSILKTEPLKKYLCVKKGFIALKGDEDLIEKRLRRQKVSVANIKKIKRWTPLFRFIPYVRGVFVTGTLSMKNARKQSDWDILLVLAKGRIWIGRLFIGIILHVLGKRRHGEKVEKRFCLNHYITEVGLILEEHSTYCAYFTTFSFPIVGGSIHKRFLQLNEQWVRSCYPNYRKDELTEADIFKILENPSLAQKVLEFFLEITRLAPFINKAAKKVMIRKIKENPKTHLKRADIRCNDTALIFLPKPHRIKVARITKEKLTKLAE
ncbi:MAG: hypothetical protein U9M90_02330 [Patescibacteria group bacterium]|nr:hypothetical protein [Patescibacteria group bacterium]